MKYFDRVCAVDFSNGIRIDGNRITYEVKKGMFSEVNSCRIDIYNLSENLRNQISRDTNLLVRLLAGYSQNTGLIVIGQGTISNVVHRIKSPDIITTIYCKDGFSAVRGNNISLSFAENTTLGTVIDAIISKLKIPVRFANYDRNIRLQTGFAFLGSVNEALDSLAKQYNFNWSIQGGQIQILGQGKNTGKQIVVLSPSTGLVEDPELIFKTKVLALALRNDYKLVSLLQPQIEVGDIVSVETPFLTGTFVIKDVLHKGDTHGNDWITTMIVSEQ